MDINLFKQIFDNMPHAIWIKDTDSIYLTVNLAFVDFFKKTEEELVGKNDYEVFQSKPVLAKKYRDDDNRVIHTRKKIEYDEIIEIEGEEKIVHAIKMPLLENDTIVGIMGVAWDATEHKGLEKVLENEKIKLERSIENEKIRLEKSNKDLESFAYMASHDLQEPLRTIANYLQLLEKNHKDDLDQKAKEYINGAIYGARCMKRLIDNLLDYSRITSQDPQPTCTPSSKVIANVRKSLTALIKESGARLHFDCTTEELCGVDPTYVEIILQNLVHNAIKYQNADKTPQIRIQCVEDEDKYTFTVKDNGPGIDSSNHERIFEGFQRLSKKKNTEGVGLGLAICKKILERHKGHIWVESELNKGATFKFTINKEWETKDKCNKK